MQSKTTKNIKRAAEELLSPFKKVPKGSRAGSRARDFKHKKEDPTKGPKRVHKRTPLLLPCVSNVSRLCLEHVSAIFPKVLGRRAGPRLVPRICLVCVSSVSRQNYMGASRLYGCATRREYGPGTDGAEVYITGAPWAPMGPHGPQLCKTSAPSVPNY